MSELATAAPWVAQKGSTRFEAVDSLRGFAALAVALHHLQVASHVYDWAIVRNAYLFVEFFFVLSGFVIAHAYHSRLQTETEVKMFAIKRVARVWPLHLFMLGAFVFAETALFIISHKVSLPLSRPPFSEDRTLAGLPVNFFMLNGILPLAGSAWNGPSWSISVELLTYAVFAGTIYWGGKQAPRIQVVLMIAALAVLFFSIADLTRVARCFYSFFLGVGVWRYRHLAFRLPATLFEIASLIAAIVLLTLGTSIIQLIILPPIFALIVAVIATEQGRTASLLRNRLCLALGKASYSIYMVHFFIAFVITNVIKVVCRLMHVPATLPGTDLAMLGRPGFIMDVLTIAYLLTVVLVAQVTYAWVEKPGMKLGGKIADHMRERASTTPRPHHLPR